MMDKAIRTSSPGVRGALRSEFGGRAKESVLSVARAATGRIAAAFLGEILAIAPSGARFTRQRRSRARERAIWERSDGTPSAMRATVASSRGVSHENCRGLIGLCGALLGGFADLRRRGQGWPGTLAPIPWTPAVKVLAATDFACPRNSSMSFGERLSR